MNAKNVAEAEKGGEGIAWKDFLESQPPGKQFEITDMIKVNPNGNTLVLPTLSLYCDSDICGGIRYFDPPKRKIEPGPFGPNYEFLFYSCRHCQKTSKLFAVRFEDFDDGRADAIKIGEWPPFGPHVPTKMFSLLGEDQATFHKGRRAESQGLGIGAFAYYRRVVENQKNRLIDEIIKVSKVLNAPKEVIENLHAAREETQFHKAVGIIKDGIPDVLRIAGHNPLTLLHDALSDGLHDQSDEECLARATVIRTVMADLAERIVEAMKEQAELNQAVSKLLQFRASKTKPVRPNSQSSEPAKPAADQQP